MMEETALSSGHVTVVLPKKVRLGVRQAQMTSQHLSHSDHIFLLIFLQFSLKSQGHPFVNKNTWWHTGNLCTLKPRHSPLLLDEKKCWMNKYLWMRSAPLLWFGLCYIIVLVIGSQTEVNLSCLMMCCSLAWLVKGCEWGESVSHCRGVSHP